MFTLSTFLSFLFISCSFFNSSLTFFNFTTPLNPEKNAPSANQENLLCIIKNKEEMINILISGSGIVQPTIDPKKTYVSNRTRR